MKKARKQKESKRKIRGIPLKRANSTRSKRSLTQKQDSQRRLGVIKTKEQKNKEVEFKVKELIDDFQKNNQKAPMNSQMKEFMEYFVNGFVNGKPGKTKKNNKLALLPP